ncbi:unnamed protein product [Cyprideis torosa]|uniref:Uncharacterized protein n=1 Tax=Cyprideis torosa TaxID=163714 RepID=A0A7R8ZNN6_9CRUS|nr:unnamed protein product [Cyprideis torosa]CAG0886763.1 unnamed protein product [Cyprideis torosa]
MGAPAHRIATGRQGDFNQCAKVAKPDCECYPSPELFTLLTRCRRDPISPSLPYVPQRRQQRRFACPEASAEDDQDDKSCQKPKKCSTDTLASAEVLLDWLVDEENRELENKIEEVNDRMLDLLLDTTPLLAVFFYSDLKNEEGLLEWLIDDDNRELEGEIEEVNGRMFERLLDESPFLAVLFWDLTDEDRVLQWLTSQDVFEIKDEIEEVNRKMLEKLLDENDFVSVFFYDNNCPKCDEALKELEHIDDETDDLDITFVKIKDARYAKKYGITKVPALVYFRKRFPSIYRGDLTEEEEVLDWLQKNRFKHPELNLFMYGLAAISIAFVMYTLFLMFCFKQTPPTSSTTTNLASSSGHQKTS